MSTDLSPRKDDLRRSDLLLQGTAELFGDVLDLGSVDEKGYIPVVIAERRVGGNVDIVLLAEVHEVWLDKARVALDLVHSGRDAGIPNHSLELCE